MTSSKPAPEPARAPAPRDGARSQRGESATGAAQHARNPGTDLHPEWLRDVRLDPTSADRIADRLAAAEAAPAEVEARQLALAVELLDLTTLDEHDTARTVRRLCADAREPLGAQVLEAVGRTQTRPRVAAVCVHDRLVPVARTALEGSDVAVAAVTAGFPEPHRDRDRRLREIRATVAAGAEEVDAVITVRHVLERDWGALHEEVHAMRDACGSARLKTILRAGALDGLDAVYRSALVCCMAGADFVKTSTGREAVNATLPIGLATTAALRAYAERTGYAVGFKPAGGIRTTDDALSWLRLVRRELGDAWLTSSRCRIGASSLLGRIQERLESLARGRE